MPENNGDDPTKVPPSSEEGGDDAAPDPDELAKKRAQEEDEFEQEAEDMRWVDDLVRQADIPLSPDAEAAAQDARTKRLLEQMAADPSAPQENLSLEKDAEIREMIRQMEAQRKARETGVDPTTGQPLPGNVTPMQPRPNTGSTDTIPPKEPPEPPAPLPGPGHPQRGPKGGGTPGGGNPTGGGTPGSV